MKVFALILCLLNSAVIFGSAAKPPISKQPESDKQIADLISQAGLAKKNILEETRSDNPNVQTIQESYFAWGKVIYKLRILDLERAKEIIEARKYFMLPVTTILKKKMIVQLKKTVTLAQKIYYKDFFDPCMEKAFAETFQDIVKNAHAANNLLNITFLKEALKDDQTTIDELNKLFRSLNTSIYTMFSSILKKITESQIISLSHINIFDLYKDDWVNTLNAINQNDIMHPLLIFFNLNEDRDSLKSKIYISELLNNIKLLNKQLIKLESFNVQQLEKNMKFLDYSSSNPWNQIKLYIREITQKQFIYGDSYKYSSVTPEAKRAIIAEYQEMAFHFRSLLNSLENIKKFPESRYADLPLDRLNLFSTYPIMYGRILGLYETMVNILADLKIVELNTKNLLNPFKKVHKEIIQITEQMEQSNIKKREASKIIASSTGTAAAGTAPAITTAAPQQSVKKMSDHDEDQDVKGMSDK